MKFLAVLLCMSGLAAVCLGQSTTTNTTNTNTTTSTASTATTTSVPAVPPGSGGSGSSTTTTTAGGGGTTTTTTSAGSTAPATYTCMNCTGDEASACGRGDGNTVTTTVTCDACWVYRDENTTSGEVTYIRGCAQDSDTCTTDAEKEVCDEANTIDIKRCSRCCKTDSCNDDGLAVQGDDSGASDVHVSIVVTMASTLFAILALW